MADWADLNIRSAVFPTLAAARDAVLCPQNNHVRVKVRIA